MLDNFIDIINRQISNTFAAYNNITQLNGLTELVNRNINSVKSVMPGVVSKSGEVKYVGPDDKFGLQVYHRLSAVTTAQPQAGGYGDELIVANTYTCAMFIFLDRAKINYSQSELLELLQASFPDELSLRHYESINVTLQSANVSTSAVLNAEFNGALPKVQPQQMFFQINYLIAAAFRKPCAIRCA